MDTDTPEPRDATQFPNPITESNIAKVGETCLGGKRLIAGFVNPEEPDPEIEVLVLHLDDDLDAKTQQVWEDYVKDPTSVNSIHDMCLYNVKDFKSKLVILAGTPGAVEKAKSQGLVPHPDILMLNDPPTPVSDKDAGIPNPVTREKTKAPSKNAPPPDTSGGDNPTDAQQRTLKPNVEDLIAQMGEADKQQMLQLLQVSQPPAALTPTPTPEPSPTKRPASPTPNPDEPPTKTPNNKAPFTGYIRPSTEDGFGKLGDASILLDNKWYTEYSNVIRGDVSNANDGIESLYHAIERHNLAVQDPVLDWNNIDITRSLEFQFDRLVSGTFVDSHATLTRKIRVGAEDAYHPYVEINGQSTILNDPICLLPNYFFVFNAQNTPSTKRQCAVMSNIYRCRTPEDFEYIQKSVSSREKRTDQTARYLKGWLTYNTVRATEEWTAKWGSDPNYSVAWTRNVQNASTIYYDAVTAPSYTATRNFLEQVTRSDKTPYYAPTGDGETTVLVDALMSAQYPVWTPTVSNTTINNVNMCPLPGLVHLGGTQSQSHVSYTQEASLYSCQNAAANVLGGQENLDFHTQPPSSTEIFISLHKIATANNEIDSWLRAYMLAAQIGHEWWIHGAANPNTKDNVCNALLDHDVLTVGYSNPTYRLLSAFNEHKEPSPLGPNERALRTAPPSRQSTLQMYVALTMSYARSCTLAAYNLVGSELARVPTRHRGAASHQSNTRMNHLYIDVIRNKGKGLITSLTASSYHSLFGFNLPMDYEDHIWRWNPLPLAARSSRLNTFALRIPHITFAPMLLDLLVKVPAECGLFIRSTKMRLTQGLRQVNAANNIDQVTTFPEVQGSLWSQAQHCLTPVITMSIHLRSLFSPATAAQVTFGMLESRIHPEMDRTFDATFIPTDPYPAAELPAQGVTTIMPNLEFQFSPIDYSGALPTMKFPTVSIIRVGNASVNGAIQNLRTAGDVYNVPLRWLYDWASAPLVPANLAGFTQEVPLPELPSVNRDGAFMSANPHVEPRPSEHPEAAPEARSTNPIRAGPTQSKN